MWTSATDQSRFVHLECSAPLFQDSYKRNNKSSGNKHLRCFPHCCKAHNASGYCGSTLQVLTAVEHADMMLFAKFDLEQAADDIQVSSVVHVSEFEKSPYLRGRRLPDPSPGHMYEINSRRNSWHYGWVSSRFVKSTVKHHLKVYILVPVDTNGNMLCVDVLMSKSFFIESTRTGTKLQAKLLKLAATQAATPPTASSSIKPTRTRPHLVLEDPATLDPPMNRMFPRKNPILDMQSSFLPPAPLRKDSSPLTIMPSYHIMPFPTQATSCSHSPTTIPSVPFPWVPPKSCSLFGHPPVIDQHVLGNDSFLDSLISGMQEEDGDEDLWTSPLTC
ncbi:hypothetical protein AaE_010667 [Aphanomyces astaci]|uniref:Uncharacterized protein n=1 Tax=Aphanomyces astaci TaxID=112090 RepID=A0A6A4ZX35_APHAT|nr:hypothetical protein AaE_010667 [Aphanomyces astaci]